MFAFRSQELALDMKEGIRVAGLVQSVVHDLHRFHLFIWKALRISGDVKKKG